MSIKVAKRQEDCKPTISGKLQERKTKKEEKYVTIKVAKRQEDCKADLALRLQGQPAAGSDSRQAG